MILSRLLQRYIFEYRYRFELCDIEKKCRYRYIDTEIFPIIILKGSMDKGVN